MKHACNIDTKHILNMSL